MKRTVTLVCAAIIAGAPAAALATPGQSQGSTNGQGHNHLNSPPNGTGQPDQSCEDTPNTPGNSADAPRSAFNPDGTSGSVYAGERPQNTRNTASVSQYDVACSNQPF
jgi:hypothetical protein